MFTHPFSKQLLSFKIQMATLSEIPLLGPKIGRAMGVYTNKFYGVTPSLPAVKSQSGTVFTPSFFFS